MWLFSLHLCPYYPHSLFTFSVMSLPLNFTSSSFPCSLGHTCGDLSERLCWLIGRQSPYIRELSAGLQNARAVLLSPLTTQVAPFGLNELWRVLAMPACPTLRLYAQTHMQAFDTKKAKNTCRHTHTHNIPIYVACAHAGTLTYLTPWLSLPRTPAFPHDLSHSINRQ